MEVNAAEYGLSLPGVSTAFFLSELGEDLEILIGYQHLGAGIERFKNSYEFADFLNEGNPGYAVAVVGSTSHPTVELVMGSESTFQSDTEIVGRVIATDTRLYYVITVGLSTQSESYVRTLDSFQILK